MARPYNGRQTRQAAKFGLSHHQMKGAITTSVLGTLAAMATTGLVARMTAKAAARRARAQAKAEEEVREETRLRAVK